MQNSKDTLLKIKKNFKFFKQLSDEEILAICTDIAFLKVKEGESIFEQHEESNEIYCIIKGEVGIYVCHDDIQNADECTHIVNLQEKHVFGEIAAVTGEPRNASAVAEADSILLRFRLMQYSASNKDAIIQVYRNLISVLADKIKSNNMELHAFMDEEVVHLDDE